MPWIEKKKEKENLICAKLEPLRFSGRAYQ
jgi:hypothetical protein